MLERVLAPGRLARKVSADIFSVLPAGSGPQHYDRRAAAYDALVGTRLYNRVMWAGAPSDYSHFARRATTRGAASGWLLDAACGSLLFSADAHVAAPPRPTVLLDQSVAMLSRARSRLVERAGRVPEHVALLQGDVLDLPFRAGAFGTVLCMNVLHHLDRGSDMLAGLARLLSAPAGTLWVTSLVRSGRRASDVYLALLHRSGDFARPRSAEEVRRMVEEAAGSPTSLEVRGSMAYVVAARTKAT